MGKAQRTFPIAVPDPEETGGVLDPSSIGPGESSVSAQLREVRRQLNEVIADLKDKKVTPGVGAVQVQALNAILRALSEERKVVTEEEVERRVSLIEEQVRR